MSTRKTRVIGAGGRSTRTLEVQSGQVDPPYELLGRNPTATALYRAVRVHGRLRYR
jgi:hypothetical protein